MNGMVRSTRRGRSKMFERVANGLRLDVGLDNGVVRRSGNFNNRRVESGLSFRPNGPSGRLGRKRD